VSLASAPAQSVIAGSEYHPVIPIDRTLVLQGENQVQILARAGHKGSATFTGRNLKAPIEFANVVLAQEGFGGFQGMNSAQA